MKKRFTNAELRKKLLSNKAGNFRTRKQAEKKARDLRQFHFTKRPVRIVKRQHGYDVITPA